LDFLASLYEINHVSGSMNRQRMLSKALMLRKISYSEYRFPPEIVQHSIWLHLRFTPSFRDVEDLLAERGITVSYETIRCWVNHFGPMIAAVAQTPGQASHNLAFGRKSI
jgi:transposase-like protein